MFLKISKYFRPLSLLKHTVQRKYATCLPIEPCDACIGFTILPNGIRVATEYQPSEVSCVTLFAEAGPRFETACNNGISHFIEHMAYKGFCDTSQCQLEYDLLLMGANATAKTTRELQTFSIRFLTGGASHAVAILGSIFNQLELNYCAIECEKYNMYLEMMDEDKDPRAVTFDYLHQTAFQGTPLSQRVIGPSWNVRKFDQCYANCFLRQHYQPYKLCLATSGNVEHEDMVRYVDCNFGALEGSADYESDDGPARFTGSQVLYRDDSMPLCHVAIAFEAPGYTSPEHFPLLVASNIVGKWHRSQGGGDTNASPLAQAAAIDGLCESFESFYIAYRDIGLWGIYFVAKKMELENMVERIQNEWMNLCFTTQFTDMQRALNFTQLELAREMTGVFNSSHDIGTQLMYTCSRMSIYDKFYSLSTITFTGLRHSVEKILYDRCPAVAAVGPTENLPDYTRLRAGQYWLRV